MLPLMVVLIFGFAPAIAACFTKRRTPKTILSVLAFFGFAVLAAFLAAFVLVDLIGTEGVWLLSFGLCGPAFTVCMLAAWKPFKVKTRRIVLFSTVVVAVLLVAVLAGPEIYESLIPEAPGEEVDLAKYMPFGDKDSGAFVNGVADRLPGGA
jgi:hypothetical protein